MLENTYLYIVYFLHLQFFINYFNILLFVCIYVLCFTLKYMIGSYILQVIVLQKFIRLEYTCICVIIVLPVESAGVFCGG